MPTREELYAALRNADAAGDAEGARKLASFIQSMPADAASAKAATPVNKDYQEGRAKPQWQQGLAAGANGLLLGFGDELAGVGGALIDKVKDPSSDFGDNYAANRDTVRGMEAAQRERSPITTAVGQGLASIPAAFALPGLRVASAAPGVVQSIGARAAQSAGVGGVLGGVAGAGNSSADTVRGVASDAGRAAMVSGVFGGAGTPAAAAVRAVGKNVGQRLSQTSAAEFAKQKVAEALARDARGALATGGYVNPLGQAAARFSKLGDEAVVADAGGRNTNQLLDTLATLPGRTKEAAFNMLHRRQAGVGDRMRESADKALGNQGRRLGGTVDDLIAYRTQESAPLYAQLRQTDITPDQTLVDIVNTADKLGAVKLGREIATASRQPFSLDPGAQGPARWNMGDLDHIKQGIDQVLSSSKAVKPDGSFTPLGRAYLSLKDELTGQLDTATRNPQTGASLYKSAREAFSGPSALIDAANKGKQAVTRDESAILGMLKGMGDAEKEAFRVGAYEGLRGKLGTQGGQTDIMSMWKNPSTQEKLRAIFGGERAYREFASSVAKEASLKRLQSVGTGSQTAARTAGMGDLDMGALGDAGAALGAAKTGNLLTAIGSAKNAWNRVATPQSVRDEMGNMLLSRGASGRQNLNSLAPLIQQINQRNMLLSNGVGMFGAQAGVPLAVPANPYRNP